MTDPQKTSKISNIFSECRDLAFDLNFSSAVNWKAQSPDRFLIGYLPVYFPRELVAAGGGLAVGILGSGDRKQIIRGDAFYQSYICHIPRGVIEMLLDGNLDCFDGFIFPSICDVIRNLSGMFRVIKQGKFIKYLDYPQNFEPGVGGEFYERELNEVLSMIRQISGRDITTGEINNSIRAYNENRRLIDSIYKLRQEFPWRLTYENLYHVIRAGMVLPPERHNEILNTVLENILADESEPMDKIRVVVSGAFCEQPPVGLIRTIELAGCYIVDDDMLLGSRWIIGDVDDSSDDPVHALSEAYLKKSTLSSSVYSTGNKRGEGLIELARSRNADGIIFATPSFCDPALLDIPVLQKACTEANMRFASFQYSENTGQFKVIKEQVGAFSDSIKLWEDSPAAVIT